MRLTPTAEQQAIKDAVQRYAAEQVTPERLAAWSRDGVDAATWRQIAALGWFALTLPADAGGSALGLIELACLLEECGRGLIPFPVVSAIRGSAALGQLGADQATLTAVAAGNSVVALALHERTSRDPAHFTATLASHNDGIVLNGTKCFVGDAGRADLHIVAARDGEHVALVLVDARACDRQPLRSFDGDPQALFHYRAVPVLQRLDQPGKGAPSFRALLDQQTALALAEMIGGMDAVLMRSVDYVKQREQFGQKIAVFQAVQHQIADMATLYTASRHLAWQAISRLAVATIEGNELAVAAAFVGQAYKRMSLMAHHLHGGTGYVIEHPLHYYAERAQALCIRYTPEAEALEEIAEALLGARAQ